MMDWGKVRIELHSKLDPKHVQPAKDYGPKGDYLEGWFVIQEANRIFGHDGWAYTVEDCRCVSERPKLIGKAQKEGFGVTYTAKVRLVVTGVNPREDVGAGHGYDLDCGLAHESAIKEAVTDALKRALRTFGNPFGLALYDKTRENVGLSATPAEVETAVSMLEQATSLDVLSGIFAGYWRDMRHVAEHPDVMGAKDKRKAELQRKDAA